MRITSESAVCSNEDGDLLLLIVGVAVKYRIHRRFAHSHGDSINIFFFQAGFPGHFFRRLSPRG